MHWKDYVTVGAIGVVFIGIVAALFGVSADWRIMSLILLLIGIFMYVIVGPNLLPKQTGWYFVANSLSATIVICFLGLVFNNSLLFIVAGIGLIGLWTIILADRFGVLPHKARHH